VSSPLSPGTTISRPASVSTVNDRPFACASRTAGERSAAVPSTLPSGAYTLTGNGRPCTVSASAGAHMPMRAVVSFPAASGSPVIRTSATRCRPETNSASSPGSPVRVARGSPLPTRRVP
jgi:hypothetical protein